MNLDKLNAVKSEKTSRNNSKRKGQGVLTLVYSKKNGKRIVIRPSLVEALKLDSIVQLGFIDKSLVIGEQLPGISQDFSLKNSDKNKVIYSAPLVKEIIEELELNFDSRVSLTLTGVELEEYEGKMIARVYEDVQEAKAND